MNNLSFADKVVRVLAVLLFAASAFFTLGVFVPNLFNSGDAGVLGAVAVTIVFLAVGIAGLISIWKKPEIISQYFTGNARIIVFALLAATIFTACHKVPAGHRGVKVNLYGNDQGVDTVKVLQPGRYGVGMNVEFYNIPIFEQTYNFTENEYEGEERDESIEFQSGQGTRMGADIAIRYQIEESHVGELFERYRGDINSELITVFRNGLRDQLNANASRMSIEELLGSGRVEMMERIESAMKDLGNEIGVKIISVQMSSDLEVPKSIRDAIDEKVKRIQQAEAREYELRQTQAQARIDSVNLEIEKKRIIGTAQARAEANRIESASLTDKLLKQQAIEKWDGKYPQVVGDGGQLLIDVSKNK